MEQFVVSAIKKRFLSVYLLALLKSLVVDGLVLKTTARSAHSGKTQRAVRC
jgi:hypothetical protein